MRTRSFTFPAPRHFRVLVISGSLGHLPTRTPPGGMPNHPHRMLRAMSPGCHDEPVTTSARTRSGAGLVLTVLAASQFLMTLVSSANVALMATVAADLGTAII